MTDERIGGFGGCSKTTVTSSPLSAAQRSSSPTSRTIAACRSRHQPSGREPMTFIPSTIQRIRPRLRQRAARRASGRVAQRIRPDLPMPSHDGRSPRTASRVAASPCPARAAGALVALALACAARAASGRRGGEPVRDAAGDELPRCRRDAPRRHQPLLLRRRGRAGDVLRVRRGPRGAAARLGRRAPPARRPCCATPRRGRAIASSGASSRPRRGPTARSRSARTASARCRARGASSSRVAAPDRARGACSASASPTRWGIGGIRPQLCVTPPGGARRCSTLAFPRAVAVASRRFRARHPRSRAGRAARARPPRAQRRPSPSASTACRAAAAPPIVLATGDSMMQGIDGFLADELGDAARVRSDVRPGTAIGKGLEWLALVGVAGARARARRRRSSRSARTRAGRCRRPAGRRSSAAASRGRRSTPVACARMMRTYVRRGRGRVVWLTLPAPRGATADADLRRRQPRDPAGRPAACAASTVLRIDQIFTPSGYRDVMRYRGANVRVREPDGVHLNVAGTAIAATAIARALAASVTPVHACARARARRSRRAVAGRRSENVQRRRP